MGKEEYAGHMMEAVRKARQTILRLAEEESFMSRGFETIGSEQRALIHYFRSRAYSLAADLLMRNLTHEELELYKSIDTKGNDIENL